MTTQDIVMAYYAAFNNKDYAAMLSLVADDVVHEPNQGTPRHGKALFETFVARMDECYAETLADIVYLEAPGHRDRAAVQFVVHGRYLQGEAGLPAAHGQSYVLPAAAFLEITEGKITRITTYYNLEHWIQLVSTP